MGKHAIWARFGGKLKNHKCFNVTIRLFGEIQVKSIRKSAIVATITIAIITFALLNSGLVSALNQDEASVRVFFVPSTLTPGQSVTIQIFFITNSTDNLQITNVGIHFDWMAADGFYGYDLSSAPVTITSGSGPYAFQSIFVTVPLNVTGGVHTYFVGIDGKQGASAATFSWSSPVAEVEVNGTNTGPTPTATNSGGQPAGQSNLLLYGAIGAAVVIVALLIIVLMVRKNRAKPKQPKSETKEGTTPQEKPSPEKKPSPEQDFNI